MEEIVICSSVEGDSKTLGYKEDMTEETVIDIVVMKVYSLREL